MEDNVQIYIQTKSDEKMENAINKFCNSICVNRYQKKLAYYFITTKLLCIFMFFKKKETKDVDREKVLKIASVLFVR